MKRYLRFAIIIALLLSVTPLADASVGYQKDGVNTGNASKIDIRNGYSTFDGSTLTFFANGYGDGVTTNVSSESNLLAAALAYGVIIKSAADGTAAQNTVGLANGTAGQMVTIMLTLKGTNSFVIDETCLAGASTINTGWATLTFDTSLDSITLLYVDDTYGWIIVGNNGVTIA